MGKYNEVEAKANLKNRGVDFKGKQITVKRAGIKLWGMIDYLCNHCKYSFYKEEKSR